MSKSLFPNALSGDGNSSPESQDKHEAHDADGGDDDKDEVLGIGLCQNIAGNQRGHKDQHDCCRDAHSAHIDAGLLLVRQVSVVVNHPVAAAHCDDGGKDEEQYADCYAAEYRCFHDGEISVCFNCKSDIKLISQR